MPKGYSQAGRSVGKTTKGTSGSATQKAVRSVTVKGSSKNQAGGLVKGNSKVGKGPGSGLT